MATVTAQGFFEDPDGLGHPWAERKGSLIANQFGYDPWSHNTQPFESPPTDLGELYIDDPAGEQATATQGAAPVNVVSGTVTTQRGPSHFDDYNNRYHLSVLETIAPGQVRANQGNLELGDVVGAQARALETWSCFPSAKTLNSIVISDPTQGVSVSGGRALPGVFPPYDAEHYTLDVEAIGPSLIDLAIDWNWADPVTVSLLVTGRRIQAFAVPPQRRIGETLETFTQVIRARSGKEQRRTVRQAPRQAFTYRYLLDDATRRRIDLLLWNLGGNPWAVPIWWDGAPLEADVVAGGTTLLTNTTDRQYVADGLAVLFVSPFVTEVVEIQSVAVGQLNLSRPLVGSFDAGTQVLPAVIAIADAPIRAGDWPIVLAERTIEWTSIANVNLADEAGETELDLGYPTYQGAPVLDDPWIIGQRARRTIAHRVTAAGFASTELANIRDELVAEWTGQRAWFASTRAQEFRLRKLWHAVRGPARFWWQSTNQPDLVIVQDVSTSATTLTVEFVGYADNVDAQQPNQDLQIELFDGTIVRHRITASVVSGGGATEDLTITPAIASGFLAADVKRVSFLRPTRFSSDRLQINHDGASSSDLSGSVTSARGG